MIGKSTGYTNFAEFAKIAQLYNKLHNSVMFCTALILSYVDEGKTIIGNSYHVSCCVIVTHYMVISADILEFNS